MQPHPTPNDMQTTEEIIVFAIYTAIGILIFLVALMFYLAHLEAKQNDQYKKRDLE